MEKIVFINQDIGYLMIDIINAHVDEGYDCVLMSGRVVELNDPLDERVKLEKIIKYNRSTILWRIVSWCIAFLQIWIKVLFKYRGAKLMIVGNPPCAPLLPLVCRNRYYQLLFDLDIARILELSIFKKSHVLTQMWTKLMQKVIGNADSIFTLTEGMAKEVRKFSEGGEVFVMPLWAADQHLRPIAKEDNKFVKKHRLEDKFVVLYSGNLGVSSGVEPLIEIANQTNHESVRFFIIGEGLRKESLINLRDQYKLQNCTFLPWQEPEMFPYSLSSADLAVVSLTGSESNRSIPSKLYNSLTVGSPILCLASNGSDLSKLVKSLCVGRAFEPHQIKESTDFIDQLYSERKLQHKYHMNSIEASKKFTTSNINIILNNL